MTTPDHADSSAAQQESSVPGTVEQLTVKRDAETNAAISKVYAELAAIRREHRKKQIAAMYRLGNKRYRAA